MRSALALVVACGCGRLGFEGIASTPDGDPILDAAPDAPPGPPVELVIPVDPGPHHVGDTTGTAPPQVPEGTSVMIAFQVADACTTATLELELTGPWGPNRAKMPVIEINGVALGSIRSFYPPDGDPRWGPNGDYDGNPPVIATLACESALAVGTSSFRFATANPADDIYLGFAQVRCRR